MAVYEGQGQVVPKPAIVQLEKRELLILKAEAERRSQYRDYGKRFDRWGKGLVRSQKFDWAGGEIQSAVLAPLIGMVGEYAVKIHIERNVAGVNAGQDFRLLKNGDGGNDLDIRGLSMQIKCRKKSHHTSSLVRKVSESGRQQHLLSDAWVFTQWDQAYQVEILGFVRRRQLMNCTTRQAPAGHLNIVVEDYELDPISRLIDDLRTRGEAT